jgi:hypothetical protein
MYAYGNHICVSTSVEVYLISYCCVATTFEQECILVSNDQRPILAKLECVGWVGEILELNYKAFNIVVLLCN